VTSVLVRTGQFVRAGAPLFAMEGPDVSEYLARHSRARLDSEYTGQTKNRGDQRGKPGELVIKAPRSGTVVEQNLALRRLVDSRLPAVVLATEKTALWVVAELPESDMYLVGPTTPARVVIFDRPDEAIETDVEAVSPVVDTGRRTAWVRIELENRDGRIHSGMSARVQFLTAPSPPSVEVPASAIAARRPNHFVFVQAADAGFVRRSVTVGTTRQGLTTITSGLVEGELVVERSTLVADDLAFRQ
jgi:RND family efflux transporter MFP subunit